MVCIYLHKHGTMLFLSTDTGVRARLLHEHQLYKMQRRLLLS